MMYPIQIRKIKNTLSKNIFFLFLVLIFNNCTTAQTKQEPTQLSATEFADKISTTQDAIILDVRTPEEFEKGHLDKAVNINWNSNNFSDQISKLDKTKPVFVYCLSGGRSAAAAKKMRTDGFKNVIEMSGGLMAWRKDNLPEAKAKTTNAGMSIEQYRALLHDDKLVLVDFYADWCIPCKKMEPHLQKIAHEMPDKVKLVRINADENKTLCQALGISAIPVLQLYKDNKLIWKNEGYINEEDIRRQLK